MTKIAGWRLHGETSCRDLIAGVLPANGMHFLVCAEDDTRRAIVADLAVSIAAGNMARDVVQEAKKADGWRIVGGFLGLQTGEPCGVAVIGSATQTDIDVAAAWRGIKSFPPIAVSAAPKNDIVSARLHDLRSEMDVGIVIVEADWSRGIDEVKRILNYRGDFAVLAVSATEPPANVMQDDSRVLRAQAGQLSIAHPAIAKPWSRSFSLEAIKIGGERAWGVRAGSEAVSVPEIAKPAPEGPQTQEIRTIVFGSDGVTTPDAVVAAVRNGDRPIRIVAPASDLASIRAALDEAKETANRRLDLALGYRLRDARDRVASAA